MEVSKTRPLSWRQVVRTLVFLLLLALVLGAVSKVVTTPNDYRNYQWVRAFYEEPKDSLDVVVIGSSVCYSEINPLFVWNYSGIALWDYATNSQPLELAEYIVREGIKRQPDALYMISLNTLDADLSGSTKLHYLTDYMPLSLNKIRMIDRYVSLGDEQQLRENGGEAAEGRNLFGFQREWEYLFPIVRYHSRWDELQTKDFSYAPDGMKGSPYYSGFLMTSRDITGAWKDSSEILELEEQTKVALERLLTLIREEEVNVLFTILPRAENTKELVSRYNAVIRYVTERGYDVLDLRDLPQTTSLDLVTDFYNNKHTNIHGANIVSRYVADYLTEHYDFRDKRGMSGYESWDEGAAEYLREVSPYFMDFELDIEHRNDTLAAPELKSLKYSENKAVLTWSAVDGADGYRIYRKDRDPEGRKDDVVGTYLDLEYDISGWKLAGDVDGGSVKYTDSSLKPVSGRTYYYTVVPYTVRNGETYLGKFSYAGIGKTFS